LHLTLGIDQTLTTFRTEVQPAEVFEFPPIFVGCFQGSVDDGSNRLRRWVENWLIPDKDDANLPLLVNDTWCWGYAGAMEANVKSMIDDCSSLGIEMCILDAGWYQKVGTYHKVGYWYPYPTYLPNGVLDVSNYAHSKGVRMGLWSSWTLGCDLSGYGSTVLSIYGSGMSDWFSSPGPETPGYWRFTNYNGAVACLAYQPPRDWIINDMLRCINDYDIDHLKHDRRVVAQTCNETHHGHLDNQGDISLRNANAFYDMLDTFRAEGVIIESGTMGGRILDYGLMQHCHYTGACDSYVPTLIRRAFYDVSYAMPARVLEASYLSAAQLEDTVVSLRYNLRSAMLGWCALVMNTGNWTSAQWNDAIIQFSVYKEKIRPQVRDGNLYHLTERPAPDRCDAIEYYTPVTGKGVIFAFRADLATQGAPTLLLKGLEPAADYYISFQDGSTSSFTASGQYLMETGVMVPLPIAPSSEWIYIEKQ
ncbi:MAG: alpha-galactosidase, partial [Planctomycetota bacterium]